MSLLGLWATAGGGHQLSKLMSLIGSPGMVLTTEHVGLPAIIPHQEEVYHAT